ncbi:MAG: hypothetical protein KGM18_07475 [Sphingomonadales bacterium]|nr:hypothetical protein [Sphingomonadales bacterium]
MRTIRLLAPVILFAMPAAAHAGACEDGFVKKGNFIGGLRFIASQSVIDLPPAVAINQLQAIATRRGYQVITAEPEAGALLIEQARQSNARGFPIELNATQEGGLGIVRMEAKLPAGMNAPSDGARTEMCGMLAELKGGKAGKLAAGGAATATPGNTAPVALSAQELSQQISKDAERNAAIIPARYANRRFTLSGTVDFITGEGKTNAITFKILQPEQMAIRLPNMASKLSRVSCLMAPGTSVFTLQLKPGKSVKLTGIFAKFLQFEDSIWLKDCVPAK